VTSSNPVGTPSGYQRKQRRKTALWTERSSWDSHWRDIAKYLTPRSGRFQTSDVNRGEKKHGAVIDSTGARALRTLAAGMMSGMTSPARPWFRLALQDRDLMESAPVKLWLFETGALMRAVFGASNTYQALHQCYTELGAFGTWADFVQPDFDNVIHHYPMTVGEYALAANDKGVVDTLAREFKMTVGQMVRQFGREACSTAVRNLHDRGILDAWVDVVHIVEPRASYDRTKRDNLNMPFASCYFEPAQANWDRYLSESGYKRFPALCPRWEITGNDVYGGSPAMECLGDVKANCSTRRPARPRRSTCKSTPAAGAHGLQGPGDEAHCPAASCTWTRPRRTAASAAPTRSISDWTSCWKTSGTSAIASAGRSTPTCS
jgi:hypothetical protein